MTPNKTVVIKKNILKDYYNRCSEIGSIKLNVSIILNSFTQTYIFEIESMKLILDVKIKKKYFKEIIKKKGLVIYGNRRKLQ